MSVTKRNDHLKEFFSAEVLKQLDEAEKNVLYEEFANSELRILSSQPIEAIHNRLATYLKAEYERRLKHIQPEEYKILKPWYLENCHTVNELYCSKCGALLGIEVDTIDDTMNPYHHEGKFIIPIGDKLMAYRPRLDGIMGFQCGNPIESEYKKEWDEYPKKVEAAQEAREKASDEYLAAVKAYGKLSKKKRLKATPPTLTEVEFPDEPEGPAFVECGNDTRWAQIELDNVPEAHVMTSVTKEDRIKVKQEMNATNYAPDVKKTKRGKTVESFELRKVK